MDVAQMGSALNHWFGFQEQIGREFMMNEDAMKYSISDYLANHGGISNGYGDAGQPLAMDQRQNVVLQGLFFRLGGRAGCTQRRGSHKGAERGAGERYVGSQPKGGREGHVKVAGRGGCCNQNAESACAGRGGAN
jgi:hypothetical protein